MKCRRSIFSVCLLVLLLVCCHTQRGEIFQSRSNMRVDTIHITDTVHNKTTERYYIREVKYKDTVINGEVKEMYIYKDKNESKAGKQNVTSIQRNDTTYINKHTNATNERKPSKFMQVCFHVVSVLVIILVSLLVVVLYLRHNKR